MAGGGEPARISTSAKHSWRAGVIDNPAVNSLTRKKPKKATQHASQNIAASAAGPADARVVCMVSRIDLVMGRRRVRARDRVRWMPRRTRRNRGASAVGSGRPASMWRDLTVARYMATVEGATDCASPDTYILSRNSEEGRGVDVHKDGNKWQKVQNLRWPVEYVRREFAAKP